MTRCKTARAIVHLKSYLFLFLLFCDILKCKNVDLEAGVPSLYHDRSLGLEVNDFRFQCYNDVCVERCVRVVFFYLNKLPVLQ